MDNQPPISLGMLTYNGALYIEDTLRYWLGQSYKNIELIISDNASVDATQEI